MRSILMAGVALAGAFTSFGPALAADLVEPPPVYVEPAPPVYVESTGGFYIRGDVGYATKSKTSGDYKFWNCGVDQHGNVCAGTIDQGVDEIIHYDKIELRGSGTFGVGLGYRFTDSFRMDATLDYMNPKVKGESDCGYLVEVGMHLSPVLGGCKFNDSSKAAIWTAMANAYVEPWQMGVFKPYLGAGVGFAHVKYDEMKNEIYCGTQPGCHGLSVPAYVGYHEGMASWRFAASLMAGASVDITQNLKFDAGYKYTRIAKGDAFGFDEQDRSYNASGVQGRDHGFDVHAIRAGLRYEFGGGGLGKGVEPVPAPYEDVAFEPAPVYSETPVYK